MEDSKRKLIFESDTKDMPTAYGSAIYAGSQPGVDATLVAVLRQAGALVYGKTVRRAAHAPSRH